MTLALRELVRRPGRFAVATIVLTVLGILLMFLGGLLDGLVATSTGAYRAQRADVFVFDADAKASLLRSRIDASTRQTIAGVPGVTEVGGLSTVQLGARQETDPTSRSLIGVALFGYEMPVQGLPEGPPLAGEVIADRSIRADGVDTGDILLLGPRRTPVKVVGFVDDTQYAGQISLWGSMETWRTVAAANRPDRLLGDGASQILVVRADDPVATAERIDRATSATSTLTVSGAIEAIPGVTQQRSTFNQIIAVTAVIAMIVVALFFALITVERLGLYGTLKALGGSSGALFAGVVAQAAVVAGVAWSIATAAGAVMDWLIPAGSLPYQLTIQRAVSSLALMLIAAAIGSAFSLRRILRVDPATAIGGAP